MKENIATDAAYRKVVAALDDCEKRYARMIEGISETDDSRFEATLAALRHEMDLRRRLEGELLTAIESERQRIGQDLHDELCQLLGATALSAGSIAKTIAQTDEG